MEEGGDTSSTVGGIATDGATSNLQRSRSIPEPIYDPQEINDLGRMHFCKHGKNGGGI